MPSRMTCPAATPPSCAWRFTVLRTWEAVRWLKPLLARSLGYWLQGKCLWCFTVAGLFFVIALDELLLTVDTVNVMQRSDTMDSVKQSAALCLLRLYKTSPDLVLMGEWTSRVVHLLNDQHMVRAQPQIQGVYRCVRIWTTDQPHSATGPFMLWRT